MVERSMPQNIEAEKAVLGSMLINDEAVAKVAEVISAEDFYREAHRLVFSAMMTLFDKRRLGAFDITNDTEGVDMVTVVEELRKGNGLDRAGGIAYITSLAVGTLTGRQPVRLFFPPLCPPLPAGKSGKM